MTEACNHNWELMTDVDDVDSVPRYFRRCRMCLRTGAKDQTLGPREEDEGWVLLMEGPERLNE